MNPTKDQLDALAGCLRRVYVTAQIERTALTLSIAGAETVRQQTRAALANQLVIFLIEHGIVQFDQQATEDGRAEQLTLSGVIPADQALARDVMNAMVEALEEKEASCVH